MHVYIEILRKIHNNTLSSNTCSIYKIEVLPNKIPLNLHWFWDRNLITWTEINSQIGLLILHIKKISVGIFFHLQNNQNNLFDAGYVRTPCRGNVPIVYFKASTCWENLKCKASSQVMCSIPPVDLHKDHCKSAALLLPEVCQTSYMFHGCKCIEHYWCK